MQTKKEMAGISVNDLLAELHQDFPDDPPARTGKIETEIMSSHDSDTFDAQVTVLRLVNNDNKD